MKQLNYLMMLAASIILFTTSCSKEGPTGPKGDNGQKGDQGAVGPAGPAGANGQPGSIIYSGTTTPNTTMGNNGDFYLNISNGLLYGPKTDAGWGAGFSLKGPSGPTGATGPAGATGATGATGPQGPAGATGATGAAGNTILSGAGLPAADAGKAGDYYLDKSSYKLYGPKAASGWGPATSLQGPAGTANVIYSGWNYATNFRDSTADNSALHLADLAAPALTNEIINSGQVQIYFNFGGGVYALPYTSYAGGKLNTISYLPRLKHFIITRFTADNSNTVPLSTVLQYRYIIIPGGQSASALGAKKLNLNDYEAVRKFYRIQD